MTRRMWVLSIALLTPFLLLVAGFGYGVYLTGEHRKWEDGVRARIRQLEAQCPPDADEADWRVAIDWTLNLDSNTASSFTFISDKDRMLAFARELDARLERPVEASIIDWIWSEYAAFTKGGASYAREYQPKLTPRRR